MKLNRSARFRPWIGWERLRSSTYAERLLWSGLALIGLGVTLMAGSMTGPAPLFLDHSFTDHGQGVGPVDAVKIASPIVAIAGSLGALIGGTLAGIAKIIQARGQADSDRFRALATLVSAGADAARSAERTEGTTESQLRDPQ